MKIYIKNMKGSADVKLVKSILSDLNIRYEGSVKPGEILLSPHNPAKLITEMKNRLKDNHLFIINDCKNIHTERVKHLLYKMFEEDALPYENYSVFISQHLNLNYNYVANVFSETEGVSIEHFIIEQKVAKAKELLQTSDHNISQIADILHYSSIGHFSNQFKKITGISPTIYKKSIRQINQP